MHFHKDKLIRFAHCDPAGIGFYPRYVELLNEIVEDWCSQGIGVSYWDLHEVHRLGMPAARLEIEYLQPSRYGDVLNFSLGIERIGNSSMDIALKATADGQLRLRAKLTVVLVFIDTLRPAPIEGEWRARFERFLVAGQPAC